MILLREIARRLITIDFIIIFYPARGLADGRTDRQIEQGQTDRPDRGKKRKVVVNNIAFSQLKNRCQQSAARIPGNIYNCKNRRVSWLVHIISNPINN